MSQFVKDEKLTFSFFSITDEEANSVGEIRVSKYEDTKEKNYIFWPQKMRIEAWSEADLGAAFQEAVNRKEKKYVSRDLGKPKNDPWWLLISDIHDEMGTSNVDFNISDLKISFRFFEKVFLIQDAIRNYRIIELKKMYSTKGKNHRIKT